MGMGRSIFTAGLSIGVDRRSRTGTAGGDEDTGTIEGKWFMEAASRLNDGSGRIGGNDHLRAHPIRLPRNGS